MTEEDGPNRADRRAGGDERYITFLSLSGDGIARFHLDPALPTDASEDDQVAYLFRHGRVAECNELFARFYGRAASEIVGLAIEELIPVDDPARLKGIREFVRSGYRILNDEEEQQAAAGQPSRWISATALGDLRGGRLHSFWVCLRDISDRKWAERDRERRGSILEAVAFSAARLLEPRSWREHAQEVVERLRQSAGAARAWIAEQRPDPDGSTRMHFLFATAEPTLEALRVDDPRVAGGVSMRRAGLERLETELREGRSVVSLAKDLQPSEQDFLAQWGSRSVAAVPIFANGEWWGFLGFGEPRYEREWSGPEVEALRAAATLLGAAIERERADSALQESEERFKRLAAATFEGIDITEDGVILDANEQFAQMVGLSLADLIGRRSIDFVPPESEAIVRERLATFSEERYEHLIQRRDGSSFPAEVRTRLLPLAGRTVRISAVRDVTERVEAEERRRILEDDLRQAAEQWRQTFDALDLGIVIADSSGKIVRLNRGGLEVAARQSFAHALGLRLDALDAQEPWTTARELHRQVGESGASAVAVAKDAVSGRAYYLLASPWFRPGEDPWRVVTFRDVTDFTRMQQQLRRAQTLEALGSLVAGVAHEVRNPLFSISATVDALEAAIARQSDFAECTELLRAQVGRLTQLMRDLLDYGRPPVLRCAPTQLGDIVRRAARTLSMLARERRAVVEEQLAPGLPTLELDSARVEQVLENLLANALQHAPPGSRVRVVAFLEEEGAASVVCCSVEDEGPGLSAQDVARVFDPFFTRRKGGTGLGLSIVQRIVEAHGGRITAGNREQGGARFVLRLPTTPAPPLPSHA